MSPILISWLRKKEHHTCRLWVQVKEKELRDIFYFNLKINKQLKNKQLIILFLINKNIKLESDILKKMNKFYENYKDLFVDNKPSNSLSSPIRKSEKKDWSQSSPNRHYIGRNLFNTNPMNN